MNNVLLTDEAARQIEEALHNVGNALMCLTATRKLRPMYQEMRDDAVDGCNKALSTIRAARAQEQAEQEPDYFGLTHDPTWLSIDKKQYDKLKPEGRMACYTAPPQREIEEAVKAEREACAKVCDDKHDYMCSRAAESIRARGER